MKIVIIVNIDLIFEHVLFLTVDQNQILQKFNF